MLCVGNVLRAHGRGMLRIRRACASTVSDETTLGLSNSSCSFPGRLRNAHDGGIARDRRRRCRLGDAPQHGRRTSTIVMISPLHACLQAPPWRCYASAYAPSRPCYPMEVFGEAVKGCPPRAPAGASKCDGMAVGGRGPVSPGASRTSRERRRGRARISGRRAEIGRGCEHCWDLELRFGRCGWKGGRYKSASKGLPNAVVVAALRPPPHRPRRPPQPARSFIPSAVLSRHDLRVVAPCSG